MRVAHITRNGISYKFQLQSTKFRGSESESTIVNLGSRPDSWGPYSEYLIYARGFGGDVIEQMDIRPCRDPERGFNAVPSDTNLDWFFVLLDIPPADRFESSELSYPSWDWKPCRWRNSFNARLNINDATEGARCLICNSKLKYDPQQQALWHSDEGWTMYYYPLKICKATNGSLRIPLAGPSLIREIRREQLDRIDIQHDTYRAFVLILKPGEAFRFDDGAMEEFFFSTGTGILRAEDIGGFNSHPAYCMQKTYQSIKLLPKYPGAPS